MNKQNIAALSAMLIRAGFGDDIGYRLLQRICFYPAAFTMIERLRKKKDLLTCELNIEKNGTDYTCPYYDISLIKGIVMPERTIGGISLQELDIAMGEIDWKLKQSQEHFRLDDEQTWKREKHIAQVVNQLTTLSATEEGRYFADALKLKHWSDTGLEELVGNFNAIRAKFEISQRVYFIEGEGITVDEAYRFLLNRWMEKKMQLKRREQAGTKDEEVANDVPGGKTRKLYKKAKTGRKLIKH